MSRKPSNLNILSILIIGHGRMGRAVAEAATDQDHRVAGFVSRSGGTYFRTVEEAVAKTSPDVAIDFTHADAIESVAQGCANASLPLVTGTTGWGDREEEIRKIVEDQNGTMLHAANFSIGVNLFLRAATETARLFAATGMHDVAVEERHHNRKVDAPSGTGRELARRILEANRTKTRIVTDLSTRRPEPDELHVAALRVGSEFGRHTVIFDGVDDLVELTHSARSRRGFATGSVRAAEWLAGRTGLFSIDDMLDDMVSEGTPSQTGEST